MAKNKVIDKIMNAVFLISAACTVLALIAICAFIFLSGIPTIHEIGVFKFIFGTRWSPNAGEFGILPMILGSIYITLGAILIGVTIGLFTAVYISRFARPKTKKILSTTINLLAGIPSIIYGFFGLILIEPMLRGLSIYNSGMGILAASIVLGIMILPTIISISVSSINAVDRSYYEGAIALGAKHEQAIFSAELNAARSGIMAGVVLGIGRAIGETMAVIMVAGNNPVFVKGLVESIRTMTGNIVLEMSYAGGLHREALIATGSILFIFILTINAIMMRFKNKKINALNARKTLRDRLRIRLKKRNSSIRAIAVKYKTLKVISYVSAAINARKTLRDRLRIRLKKRNSSIRAIAVKYKTLKVISYVSAAITVMVLLVIIVFIMAKGLPYVNFKLLFGKFYYGGPVTLLPSLVSTGMLVLISIAIAVPLGIFTAVYLVEYVKRQNAFTKLITASVETLAGIPSIIYGLFGMLFFVITLKWGYSILAGSMTLVIMVLPIIIKATEEALKSVPSEYREGSYALGAGKVITIFKIVFPSAVSGIIVAVVLAIGRIIGESAVLIFTAGSMPNMPEGIMSGGSSLAVTMYTLAVEGLHMNEAYASAVVLLFIVLVINSIATLLDSRFKKERKL